MNQRAGRRPAEMATTRRFEPDTLVLERPRRFHFPPVPVDSTWDDGPTEEIHLPHLPRSRQWRRNVGYLAVALVMAGAVVGGFCWFTFSYATATSRTIVCPIDRR